MSAKAYEYTHELYDAVQRQWNDTTYAIVERYATGTKVKEKSSGRFFVVRDEHLRLKVTPVPSIRYGRLVK